MFGDQFYWSSRITELGVGTTTAHATLTRDSLTGALGEALDSAIVERARSFAGQVGVEGAKIAARELAAVARAFAGDSDSH